MTRLIENNSPFRKLPAELDIRQRLVFDGIRYSVEMADLAYMRLRKCLVKVSESNKLSEAPDFVVAAALSDAWTIVDTMHRLRGLLKLFPDSSSSELVAEFLSASESIRDLRNSVQHLHARFDKLVKDRLPTWGWITWVTMTEESHCHVHALVPGSLDRLSGLGIENPGGKEVTAPIDLISLKAHGYVVSLSALHNEVRALVQNLEIILRDQFDGHRTLGADLHLVMKLKASAPVTSASSGEANARDA